MTNLTFRIVRRLTILTLFCGCLSSITAAEPKQILFFTKSSGFEHGPIRRTNGELSHAEKILTELGKKHDFAVTCTKDGGVFTPENIAKYDAFCFYTTGDLTSPGTDKQPPMSKAGKAAFLEAIRNGKGFIGTHSASDTFHTEPDSKEEGTRYQNYGEKSDPYILMLGGEFIKHGPQQKAKMTVVDPRFPGFEAVGTDFDLLEEWYSLKEFASNLHVILVQETAGMKGPEYQRGSYPATWARTYGKGRVFFTSMGHREDIWTNPKFQTMLLGGIGWALRTRDADVSPNLETAAPKHGEFPPKPDPAAEKPKTKKKA
jgi:type 1 glutamine amidotransferase